MNNKLSIISIIMTVLWLVFLVLGIIQGKWVIVIISLIAIMVGVISGFMKNKTLRSPIIMWNDFIKERPEMKDEKFEIWRFAEDDDFHRNYFARIFLGDVKGESYFVDNFVKCNVPLPKVGNLNIVCDAIGQAYCIVKTVEVIETKFADVTPIMAQIEGCKSLSEWKDYNKQKYSIIAENIGEKFSGESKIIFDKFEIIYKGKEIDNVIKRYQKKVEKEVKKSK